MGSLVALDGGATSQALGIEGMSCIRVTGGSCWRWGYCFTWGMLSFLSDYVGFSGNFALAKALPLLKLFKSLVERVAMAIESGSFRWSVG